jgi:membrane protein
MQSKGLLSRSARILAETGRGYLADNVSGLGAALAFYTTLAIAPLLVVAIAVTGILFNEATARQRVIAEISDLIGARAGMALQSLQNPSASATGTFATSLGVASLLFGVFGVFQFLQTSLNSIWRVEAPPSFNWRHVFRQRLFSIAAVMATAFLLLVSLIASTVISWLGNRGMKEFGLPPVCLEVVNSAVSLIIVAFLFALIFKVLPNAPVKWKHVRLGAFLTALLFTLGKGLLGYYLGRAAIASAYGAAGSLVLLLLWCYYAAQVFFLGAEFTWITALSNGGRDFTVIERAREKRAHRVDRKELG